MCEVDLKGPEASAGDETTPGPMRQPGGGDPCPASQPERLGNVVSRVVESVATRVNRNAITKA